MRTHVLPLAILLIGCIYAVGLRDDLESILPRTEKVITFCLQGIFVVIWYVYLAKLLGVGI